jgi:hypothetical protein
MFDELTYNLLIFLSRHRGLSLHRRLISLWRHRRLEFGDAEGAQHGGSTLSASGDRPLGGAVADFEINHADRLQRSECLCC